MAEYPDIEVVRALFRRHFGAIELVFRDRPKEDVPEPHAEPAEEYLSVPVRVEVLQDGTKPALTSMQRELQNCRACRLCESRKNVVFGVGNVSPRLVVMGEAPGEQEDNRGEPFVGKSGKMLDRMLENVLGISRDDVYILNAIKCRPPDNRTPRIDEIETCGMFLEQQLALLRPEVILAMGNTALQALFGEKGITKHRGRWRTWEKNRLSIDVMPTFHPAFLLRKRGQFEKHLVWEDLLNVKKKLEAQG